MNDPFVLRLTLNALELAHRDTRADVRDDAFRGLLRLASRLVAERSRPDSVVPRVPNTTA
jgi:hypothetical protein